MKDFWEEKAGLAQDGAVLGAEALCGWGEGIVSFEEIRLVWTQILFLLQRTKWSKEGSPCV